MKHCTEIISSSYLMESENETVRLDNKLDAGEIMRQARWAGIGDGMVVLDVGCGSGKATRCLAEIVGATGHAIGIDYSEERLHAAEEKYGGINMSFEKHDISQPFQMSRQVDAVFIRFVLEYFRSNALSVLENVFYNLKPGGVVCLVDLDCNSLLHYGQSDRLDKTLKDIMLRLEMNHNFDPFVGRKLYSYLYTLGCQEIDVHIEAHHLIFGALKDIDQSNWIYKLESTALKSGCRFEEYNGDYQEFRREFEEFFTDPARFTYTPLIVVSGIKS